MQENEEFSEIFAPSSLKYNPNFNFQIYNESRKRSGIHTWLVFLQNDDPLILNNKTYLSVWYWSLDRFVMEYYWDKKRKKNYLTCDHWWVCRYYFVIELHLDCTDLPQILMTLLSFLIIFMVMHDYNQKTTKNEVFSDCIHYRKTLLLKIS